MEQWIRDYLVSEKIDSDFIGIIEYYVNEYMSNGYCVNAIGIRENDTIDIRMKKSLHGKFYILVIQRSDGDYIVHFSQRKW